MKMPNEYCWPGAFESISKKWADTHHHNPDVMDEPFGALDSGPVLFSPPHSNERQFDAEAQIMRKSF